MNDDDPKWVEFVNNICSAKKIQKFTLQILI